jgi:hypothetical protein
MGDGLKRRAAFFQQHRGQVSQEQFLHIVLAYYLDTMWSLMRPFTLKQGRLL